MLKTQICVTRPQCVNNVLILLHITCCEGETRYGCCRSIVEQNREASVSNLSHFISDVEFLPGGDRYKPVIYFNEFWNMLRDYQPINETTK